MKWNYNSTGDVVFGRSVWKFYQKRFVCICDQEFYKWTFPLYIRCLLFGFAVMHCPKCGRQYRYKLVRHFVSDPTDEERLFNREISDIERIDKIRSQLNDR